MSKGTPFPGLLAAFVTGRCHYHWQSVHEQFESPDMSTDRMQERVNEICNDLYSKGEKVSVRVILTYLPDVSSTSTVHKYYANWRKELEANEKSLYDKFGFSSEFTQMFMKEISRFSVEAEQRYKGIAEEANEQRDAAIEELGKSKTDFISKMPWLSSRIKTLLN